MITFKKFGKTIKIRNDDWKKLRERFDANNAKLNDGEYVFLIDCPLCIRYDCKIDCPFWVYGGYLMEGCQHFFDLLFRDQKFSLGINGICWDEDDNKEARRQLRRMQKMMDKIEASQ